MREKHVACPLLNVGDSAGKYHSHKQNYSTPITVKLPPQTNGFVFSCSRHNLLSVLLAESPSAEIRSLINTWGKTVCTDMENFHFMITMLTSRKWCTLGLMKKSSQDCSGSVSPSAFISRHDIDSFEAIHPSAVCWLCWDLMSIQDVALRDISSFVHANILMFKVQRYIFFIAFLSLQH